MQPPSFISSTISWLLHSSGPALEPTIAIPTRSDAASAHPDPIVRVRALGRLCPTSRVAWAATRPPQHPTLEPEPERWNTHTRPLSSRRRRFPNAPNTYPNSHLRLFAKATSIDGLLEEASRQPRRRPCPCVRVCFPGTVVDQQPLVFLALQLTPPVACPLHRRLPYPPGRAPSQVWCG